MIHLRLFSPQGCFRRESPTYGQNPWNKDEVYIFKYIYPLYPYLLYGYARRTPTQSLYDTKLTSLWKFKCTCWRDRNGRNSFCSKVGGNITSCWPKCWFVFRTSAPTMSRIVSSETSTCFGFLVIGVFPQGGKGLVQVLGWATKREKCTILCAPTHLYPWVVKTRS